MIVECIDSPASETSRTHGHRLAIAMEASIRFKAGHVAELRRVRTFEESPVRTVNDRKALVEIGSTTGSRILEFSTSILFLRIPRILAKSAVVCVRRLRKYATEKMPQKVISIMSNSGGVGKTTLTVNLAYQLARKGKKVAMFGCDPNGSLTLFCGLDDPPNEKTMDWVLRSDFEGDYPFFPVWRDRIDGIDACLGGLPLTETSQRLVLDKRGAYLLADALEDHPISHDVLLIDCPGTIEQLHVSALSASTDVLITLKPEDKDMDAMAKLLEWISATRTELRLKPAPKVFGVVPNGAKNRAMHRDNLGLSDIEGLPDIMRQMEIRMFPTIKDNAYIANAAAAGLPLGLYRAGDPNNQLYEKIAVEVIKEMS